MIIIQIVGVKGTGLVVVMVVVDALELDDLVDILGRPISFIDAVTGRDLKTVFKLLCYYCDNRSVDLRGTALRSFSDRTVNEVVDPL